MRLIGHATQIVGVVPALGFDDQRVIFPACNGVAFPFALLDVEVIGVGNDAGGMHHLIQNHHVILGLHQLHVVVVGSRYHRWATDEAGDTAVYRRAPFRTGTFKNHLLIGRPALLSRLIQAGNAAVGRVINQ